MAGVNVRNVPNFEAFRGELGEPSDRVKQWLDKLEEWATASVHEIGELDGRIESFERMDAENAAAQEKYDALVVKIEDYARGIVTPDELIASVA